MASRSSLVQEGKLARGRTADSFDKLNEQKSGVPDTVQQSYTDGDQQDKLLPLPLPDLESSLKLYLIATLSFLSADQLQHTSAALREFQDGAGRQLQKRLLDRMQDPQIDDWQHDLQVSSVYLDRRDPVYPYGIFYGSHILTEKPHSQVERAAIISTAAYQFKRRIDAGDLEQDYMNDEPLCMHSLR